MTLIKTITEALTSDELPNKEKLKKIFDFLENNSYTKDELIEIFLLGNLLKAMGKEITDSVYADIKKYARKDKEILAKGAKLVYVESDNYEFLSDDMLDTYQTMYDKQKKELDELKQSIKNRKEQLINEDKALKLESSEQVRVYF